MLSDLEGTVVERPRVFYQILFSYLSPLKRFTRYALVQLLASATVDSLGLVMYKRLLAKKFKYLVSFCQLVAANS